MIFLTTFEIGSGWITLAVLLFIFLIAIIIRTADINKQDAKGREKQQQKMLDEYNALRDQYNAVNLKEVELAGVVKQKDIMIQSVRNEMIAFQNEVNLKANEKGQELAALQFNKWKTEELQKYIKIIEDSGKEKATAMLNQWLIDEESRIRKDAANRSVRNVLGKVTEHLIPFSEALKDFNPKDMRFIGSPIDLIIFDGAEELKKDEMTIFFVEVKTGTSALSKRQQIIKDAILNRRIKWLRVDMKNFGDGVNAALAE